MPPEAPDPQSGPQTLAAELEAIGVWTDENDRTLHAMREPRRNAVLAMLEKPHSPQEEAS
ncbi:hypothetical protein HOD30_01865 [Candidatus Peregrinibacteria bacterium]|nr:hypothetical protein [Candidatus Peregrinibacteria bacterium]MBT4631764.1 hypothetical protein [Candidatus Peregrinibacteria bacterium]MBT5517289.1 hypothetical protein [Candidatus Peregrinibacteria bacterium]MBT5824511.1 hypothetical protein [Candidatus Peregrinibacteria bacterium]